jgi:hypothetical protein
MPIEIFTNLGYHIVEGIKNIPKRKIFSKDCEGANFLSWSLETTKSGG